MPSEVLDYVQRMCDHFGWMNYNKLSSLLDERSAMTDHTAREVRAE